MKTRFILSTAVAGLAALGSLFLQAAFADEEEERVWSFDEEKAGALPQGWKVAETSGQGKSAVWRVVADSTAPSPPHAVAITSNPNHGRTFNLLIAEGTEYRDLEVEVEVKAVAGREDQGGGPVWRLEDADNYYVARWNPLEDNFRVYYVKNGRRRQIASARVEADPAAWHEIEIAHQGNRIVAEFDDEKLIEVEDSTFTEAGMVGLWAKADACTAFDDLEVERACGKERREDDEGKDEESENESGE